MSVICPYIQKAFLPAIWRSDLKWFGCVNRAATIICGDWNQSKISDCIERCHGRNVVSITLKSVPCKLWNLPLFKTISIATTLFCDPRKITIEFNSILNKIQLSSIPTFWRWAYNSYWCPFIAIPDDGDSWNEFCKRLCRDKHNELFMKHIGRSRFVV